MNLILAAQNGVGWVLALASRALAFVFDATKTTFVPYMAKRNSAGPFAAGVLVQGKAVDASASDTIVVSRGTQISGNFYTNFDSTQGTINLWLTPEWAGADGLNHYIAQWSTNGYLAKNSANNLILSVASGKSMTVACTFVVGTTYHIVARWDSKGTLDGTNYLCLSVNDTHTFGLSSSYTPEAPSVNIYIGSAADGSAAAAGLIQGLCVLRLVAYDGSYGVDQAEGDVINLAYNAGTGTDITELYGSWNCLLCVPTNATPGILATGSGDAWSHPHSSNVLQQWYMGDGYYGGGVWALKLTNGEINCGNDAGITNLHNGAFTIETWLRMDAWGGAADYGTIAKKGYRFMIASDFGGLYAQVYCATTHAFSSATGLPLDGKYHHVAMTYDNAGDRKIRFFIDGVASASYYSQIAGVGLISDDSTDAFYLGGYSSTWRMNNPYGWVAISNSIRYTANFVPSRLPPAPDANTLLQLNMAEGTGTTLDNVGALGAAADGTITAGTWTPQWSDVGTPVTPVSCSFNGTSSSIDCGSEASVDNLHDAAFTAEAWVRAATTGEGAVGRIFDKTRWRLNIESTGLAGFVDTATVDATTTSGAAALPADNRWHHVVMAFDDAGDRKAWLAVDGIWYGTPVAGTGAVVDDAASSLFVGNDATSAYTWNGAIGWGRISNIATRYTVGTNFTPPARTTIPAVDANTVRLFPMNEGSGTDIADLSANDQHGTLSNGTWNVTKDMAVDAPGEREYAGGYSVGADAANEGIEQVLSGLTAGADYVLRPVLHYTPPALPIIKVLDATNGDGLITSITCPDQTANLVLNGGFDADTGSWTAYNSTIASIAGGVSGNCIEVTRTGTGASTYQSVQLTPYTTYRLSVWHKSSVAKVTNVYVATTSNGTNLLTIVVGNPDLDWTQRSGTFTTPASGIVFVIMSIQQSGGIELFDSITLTRVYSPSKPWAEPIALSLPTLAREGADATWEAAHYEVGADCVSVRVQVLNTTASGEIGLQQVEMLPNLIDNGGMEVGSGDPWIPSMWVERGAPSAGEVVQESSVVHSGSSSVKIAANSSYEGVRFASVIGTTGRFYSYGMWLRWISGNFGIRDEGSAAIQVYASSPNFIISSAQTAVWALTKRILRYTQNNGFQPGAMSTDEAGSGYADDYYLVALDPVTLTCTPASLANATETTGLRVGGRSTLTQPIPTGEIGATSGTLKWRYTPRHSAAVVAKFGETTPYIVDVYGDANNWIRVYWSAANTITLDVKCPDLTITRTWDATGAIVAGTTYALEITYSAASITFKVDDVAKITITMSEFPANWWLSGGISAGDVAAVWKPYGAASLADSYLRIAGSDGYANVDPAVVGIGVAPTLSAAGWDFNGIAQYLSTGFLPFTATTTNSLLVGFSNITSATWAGIVDASDGVAGGLGVQSPGITATKVRYAYRRLGSEVTPKLITGVLGVNGVSGFRNGIAEAACGDVLGVTPKVLYIGATNQNGTAQYFMAGSIRFIALYSRSLSSIEMLAVSDANVSRSPINLTTVPTIVYWGQAQDGSKQSDATYASPL